MPPPTNHMPAWYHEALAGPLDRTDSVAWRGTGGHPSNADPRCPRQAGRLCPGSRHRKRNGTTKPARWKRVAAPAESRSHGQAA